MTNAPTRRAALTALVAVPVAGTALTFAAPFPPALCAIDRRVEQIWLRRRRILAIVDRLHGHLAAAEAARDQGGMDWYGDRVDAAWDLIGEVETALEAHVSETVLGLAAVTMVESLNTKEDVPGLLRATLAAIRPQLVGPIAEDADRVLAAEDA
jgi:hypothetical protein